LDNSAYELFTDLCLADFFITYGFAEVVVFHGKSIPWYVSDVTKPDFEHFLNRLVNECTSSALQQIGNRWNNYYKTGIDTLNLIFNFLYKITNCLNINVCFIIDLYR